MDPERELTTPWLRVQLVDALVLLSRREWLVSNAAHGGSGTEVLDDLMDLLDDTGAVDDPEAQVGAFYSPREAELARSLGAALDGALGTSDPTPWIQVSLRAQELLDQMASANSARSNAGDSASWIGPR